MLPIMNSRYSKTHLCALFTVAIYILTGLPAQADWVEDAVTQIRARYNEIEAASLRAESLSFEATDGPESGKLTRYYQGQELVKAVMSYSMGDHGGAEESYYYSQGQLCFVYAASSSWRFTGQTLANGESETADESAEQRIYFRDGQMIRDLLKVVQVPSGKSAAQLLKAAKNQPHSDPETESRVWRWGQGLPTVRTPQEVLGLLQ
jgi:hypothetical protein